MPALARIASALGRRDDLPDRELAADLARTRDRSGVAEIASGLQDRNPRIQSDCIKVLYEIGYLDPDLVAPYAADFLGLLASRNNRLVWGGSLALATVAACAADELYPHADEILAALRTGSVITVDNAVRTLAGLAAARADYNRALFPHLLEHLATCRPKELAQHAESSLPAVTAENRPAFLQVLAARSGELTAVQQARVKKVVKAAGGG